MNTAPKWGGRNWRPGKSPGTWFRHSPEFGPLVHDGQTLRAIRTGRTWTEAQWSAMLADRTVKKQADRSAALDRRNAAIAQNAAERSDRIDAWETWASGPRTETRPVVGWLRPVAEIPAADRLAIVRAADSRCTERDATPETVERAVQTFLAPRELAARLGFWGATGRTISSPVPEPRLNGGDDIYLSPAGRAAWLALHPPTRGTPMEPGEEIVGPDGQFIGERGWLED